MQIIMNTVSRMTLQGFAEQHNLVMEINERDPNEHPNLPRYYASFEHCEVKGDGVLIGEFGNGETPEEAMENYAKRISNKRLVLLIPGKDRFELKAPMLRFVVDNN